MPIVQINYDREAFSPDAMRDIVTRVQTFAAEATGYELAEISVFASENQITANAAPIEIFVQGTFTDASDATMQSMLDALARLVADYKRANDIMIPFNLSIVKMNWRFALEV